MYLVHSEAKYSALYKRICNIRCGAKFHTLESFVAQDFVCLLIIFKGK